MDIFWTDYRDFSYRRVTDTDLESELLKFIPEMALQLLHKVAEHIQSYVYSVAQYSTRIEVAFHNEYVLHIPTK